MREMLIIAGPNGAGKTTAALALLPSLGIKHFLNADEIARGLSPLNPSLVDLQAGKLLLKRMNDMFEAGESFAVETTLSGHTYLRAIKKAQSLGYRVTIIYIFIIKAEVSIARVALRVSQGGHHIPTETIKRRYRLGLNNLLNIYVQLADKTEIYYNSEEGLELVSHKILNNHWNIENRTLFQTLMEKHDE
jgi:predicted ABC-type ATPase